jgi:predicted phage terminase large subunit-like protein
MNLTPEQLEWALRNRDTLLRDLDALESEQSLLNFIKVGWKYLEPETPFVYGWCVEAICEHLEAVSKGQIRRLLINVPPGCMKSLTTEVFWPAWEWGPRGQAHLRYISASYEKGLATRDLVRCRDLITSEWFRALWPLEFKGDQNLKTYYENSKQGWRLAASVGGALTGYRGDRIIIDDPHDVRSADSDIKREDAIRWFTETLPTRLNNQDTSSMVCVMQRLHERDVSGLIQKELSEEWEQLVLPMEFETSRRCVIQATGWTDPRKQDGDLLWPERFSRDSVEELKKVFRAQGGSYAEAAQLQQRPAPRAGGLFKRDQFHVVDAAPTVGKSIRGWDLAASTDRRAAYTVGVKLLLSLGKLYILDVIRLRGTPNEVETAIMSAALTDGHQVAISLPQDPGQAGKSQRSRLASILPGFNVHFSPETGSKDDRAIPVAAQAEAGNVYMVRAPWNDAFLAEAQLFPASEFKDQIDALSRAYAYLLTQNTRAVALEPAMIITQ